MIEEYLIKHHKSDILNILQDPDVVKHQSININFVELFEIDTNLGNNILKDPEKTLGELDDLVCIVQDKLLEESKGTALTTRKFIHARIYGLPACPELHRNLFPKNEDLNLFLQITGTVVRIMSTKMLEHQRPYICAKCKHVEVVQAIYDQRYIIIPPKKCLNPDGCPGTNLVSTGDLSTENCKDYQEIKIQEQTSKLGVDSMPCSMWVTLEDDLVDTCKPGDDVTICGIVKRRWGPNVPGKRIDVEIVLKANHVQVNNSQSSPGLITPEIKEQFLAFWEKYKSHPLEGRDLILQSFCPKLYGMYITKLAVALVLAGGSRCTEGNEIGIQLRSEPHLFLVGDPGTGKSQLLRYAAKIIPRSVLTTGVGSTMAGLTVAAVMEDGQWQLEGGALVLADGGICCIDEFNSMKAHDRTSIHEAMEQQTISVAKASIVCKLRTRCSIIAATNPKGGHLDPSQPLSLNLALPSPLLSRFDVVLMLKDYYDENWDNLVADHILSGKGIHAIKTNVSLWNLEMLQQYFTIIKSINPILTPTANTILSSYYQAQRRATLRNKARTTVRLLDSLIRLSQAHARFMFHEEVHVMDALFAITLIENSMHGECAVLMLDKINVHAPFPESPIEDYVRLAAVMLEALGLKQILQVEMTLLKNGYNYMSQNLSSDVDRSLKLFDSSDVSINVGTLNDSADVNMSSFPKEELKITEELDQVEDEDNEEHKLNSSRSSINFEHLHRTGKNNVAQSSNTDDNSINKPIDSETETENESPKANKPNISFSQFKFSKNKKPKLEQIRNTSAGDENQIEFEDDSKILNNPVSKNSTLNKEHSTSDLAKPENFKKPENKKRKKSNPGNGSKQRKVSKEADELKALNLIRSVNDDFDLSILNFEADEDGQSTSSIQPEEFDKIESIFDGRTDKLETDNDPAEVNPKEVQKLESPQKLSQNTKMKQFKEKFKFRPRDVGSTNAEVSKNDIVSKNVLFNIQDQDYDSLDYDF